MVEYDRTQERELATSPRPKICVAGIGGGGLNVLDRISLDRMMEATLVSMHTDVRVLGHSMSSAKIQLGADTMRGIGSGGDPELGREAAEASREQIRAALQGHEMVFICCGLGGGTGSGASPVVAEIAKELGAMVFVFATMPFVFEGRRRLTQAEVALEQLQSTADALILFENSRMGELILPKEGIQKAFSQADQLIGHSVRAISAIVSQPGIVRMGMADLMAALRSPNSRCLFGFGEARGSNRVSDALKRALKSPLVNQGMLLQSAKNLLVHVTGGESLTLAEVENLMKQLGKYVPEETQIMFGLAVEPRMGDTLCVTLISSLSAQEMSLDAPSETAHRVINRHVETPRAEVKSPIVEAPLAQPVAKAEPAPVIEVPQAAPAYIAAPSPAPISQSAPASAPEVVLAPVQAVSAPHVQPEAELFPVEQVAHGTASSLIETHQTPVVEQTSLFEQPQAAVVPVSAPPPVAGPSLLAPHQVTVTSKVSMPDPVVTEVTTRVAIEPQPQAPVPSVTYAAPAPHVEPVAAAVMEPPQPSVEEVIPEHVAYEAPAPAEHPAAAPSFKSSFTMVQDEDEEEEEEYQEEDEVEMEMEEEQPGTHWADKYISPPPQPQQPKAAPVAAVAPREPEMEPVMASGNGHGAPQGLAGFKQSTFNLSQEEITRFKGTDKTIVEGEDLDVPTWMRMRQKVKR